MAITGFSVNAQDIKLKSPDLNGGKRVMQALSERKSTREFSTKELSLQELSNLLWAGNGINRPEKGMRTAASCLNKQDVDIYVIMKEGAYRYNAEKNLLEQIARGNFYDAVTGGQAQAFAYDAPVHLILVSDLALLGGIRDAKANQMGAIDVGIVSGNISLYCAGAGLATVPRASMDKEKLRSILKLRTDQLPILTHTVGYMK